MSGFKGKNFLDNFIRLSKALILSQTAQNLHLLALWLNTLMVISEGIKTSNDNQIQGFHETLQ